MLLLIVRFTQIYQRKTYQINPNKKRSLGASVL
jgi:hypothetical protein